MTRLTNDIRKIIAAAAVAHTFDPRAEVLAASEDVLAREAYASLIPDSETEAIAKIPENWFRRDACLRFSAGGYRVTLTTQGQALPVPYNPRNSSDRGYGCNEIGSIPHGDLSDRIQDHVREKEALKEERRKTYRQVLTMLNAVTTINRLKEAWPEGAQFYASYDGAGKSTLPAIRVDEINAALGLEAA